MAAVRLDKHLANSGLGTRSEIKKLIRDGRAAVNGDICRTPEQKIEADTDVICVDGREIVVSEYEYYMLYKEAGCVTATKDNVHKTVMDAIVSPRKKDLFPVGRLDIDTEGLLLITNDGALAHRLLAPSKHVTKEYFALVKGRVTEDHIRAFADGIDIGDDKRTLPARLTLCGQDCREEIPQKVCGALPKEPLSQVLVTVREGRFHQIKRMFQALGMEVLYLKRLSMGSLRLDKALKKGAYRPLEEQEIAVLKEEEKRE